VPGQRLASCHLGKFAPRLSALARRVAGRGAAYGKLAVPADTPRQLAELLALQEEVGRAVSIVPTGRLAEAGRVMLAGRGAALAYGALDAARPGHPDQPLLARLHDVFHVETVGPATRFYAVVARPVAHSLSPAWHNSVFRAVGQDARLVALEAEHMADVLESADALRLDGCAVSHPLKQEALAAAASHMPGALATGAANTLLRTPAGWQARNTDWKAAGELLPRLLRGWRKAHTGQVPKVLLLGPGGAGAMAWRWPTRRWSWPSGRRFSHAKAWPRAARLAAVHRRAQPGTRRPTGHQRHARQPGRGAGARCSSRQRLQEGALVDLAYGGEACPSAARPHGGGTTDPRGGFLLPAGAPAERDLHRREHH
jgi:hypothetical protein